MKDTTYNKNTMKNTFLIILMLCITFPAFAQTSVTGKVVDTADEPLIGATVKVKDSKQGAATNASGLFTLNLKKGDVVQVSYMGYEERQVTYNGQSDFTIKMKEDTKYLDEVVVVGYGEFKREDLTGSVSVTDMDDVTKAPVPNITQALAGRIAGVQISTTDAQPGAEMNLIIRGANSLTQDNTPLYVVDGFASEDFDLSMLNPSDIESINVLKDASATAIYGSRGANGVVIVETKQGKAGIPVITYDGSIGFQQVANKMDLMNPYDFVRYQIDRDPENMTQLYLTGPELTLDDYKRLATIDWQDEIFRAAPITQHSVSMSGGSGRTRYSSSISYLNQEGVIVNTGYEKYQGRLRLDQTINDKLKVRLSVNYSRDKNFGQFTAQQQQSANAYSTYLMYRTWGYRPVNVGVGDIFDDLYDGEDVLTAIMNPVVSSNNEVRIQTRKNLMANGTIDYSILNNLRLKITAGVNERSTVDEAFNNSKTYKGYPSANNLRGVNGSFNELMRTSWTNENTLTYKTTVKRFHKFDIVGGVSLEGDKRSRYGYEVINVPNESLGLSGMDQGTPYNTRASIYENTLLSYLGRVNYNYRSRYMITASFRADGSSKFYKENRWGYFPSGAIAWKMDKEAFMKNLKFISESKLRLSYGQTGNNRINEDARFRSLDIVDYYSFDNGTPEYALGIANIGNKDLKWEKTEQIDIGYDLSLFNSRVNLVFDVYRKTTQDLLLNANMPYSSGVTSSYKNVGSVRNQGLEISLTTENIKSKDFSWVSNFNISFNRSKVLSLAEGEESILSTISWTGDWNASPLYIAKVDGPMAAFYGYVWDGNYQYDDFVSHPDGSYTLKQNVPTNGDPRESIQPGDIKYVDQNGDGIVNDKDRVVIGNPMPLHTGGFNNNFTYKDFNLNIFFQWSYGNDVFNANRLMFEGNSTNRNINQFASYNNRWTPDNQNDELFRIGGSGPRGVYSSRTIEDGSFLRLKTVQLSYNVPVMPIKGVKSILLSLSGQNLLTFTKYSGMDPEVSVRNTALTPGFDYSAYPSNRTFTFGVKVGF